LAVNELKHLTFLILLSGCSQLPISDRPIPAEALAKCQAISEKYSLAERSVTRGAIQAGRAGGVSLGISQLVPTIPAASIVLPVALGYFITSAAEGAIEAQDNRDRIVRECLRDEGIRAY